MSYILAGIFAVVCLVGITSVLWVIFFALRLIFQFSDSSDAFSRRTLWNPLNAIFNPLLLSPEGLISRKRVFRGAMAFIISLAIAGCLAIFFQILDKT